MSTKTSPRSRIAVTSKMTFDRGDQTSTASIVGAQSKADSGVVDQTSASLIRDPQINSGSGDADQSSTASIQVPQNKVRRGAVDQTSTASNEVSHCKSCVGAVDQTSASSNERASTKGPTGDAGPFLADPILGIMAYAVDDLEMVRIANENRLRALTSEHRLTLDHPDVMRVAVMVAQLNTKSKVLEDLGFDTEGMNRGIEQEAILNMNRALRRHPLWDWAKPITGLGEKQFARLLAVIGDPYWNDLHDRPRTMRELRAYCGWHVIETGHADKPGNDINRHLVGVAPKRQRGQQSNWNDEARKRVWLIAESCMKQRKSIYRDVYDTARKQYADTVHPAPCVRCGPKGKPALVGSPRSDGHQHAMALRKVAVALLADLWREAKRLHEQPAV